MNTNAHESEKADAVIESVIGAAYEVSNVPGAGFWEKVYERALSRELGLRGLKVAPQVPYPVVYKGQQVGEYVADLLVDDCVLVELKCVDRFSNEHLARKEQDLLSMKQQMNRPLNFAVIVIAATLPASSLLAHHSFAMFDQSKSVELRGTVKSFRWSNPHVFIQLLVAKEGSDDEEWSIEMTSPEHLARVGWKPGTLKPGDKVTLVIHPMRNGVTGGQYLSGTGPGGALMGSPQPAQGEGK